MSRYIDPRPQYFDDAGAPEVSGELYFFTSGTEDPLATYADEAFEIPNAHPVELSGSGRIPNIWLQDLRYKVRLIDSDGVQQWEIDPYVSPGGAGSGSFPQWDSTATYGLNDTVQSDGLFYISLTDANEGNDPASVASAWTQITYIRVWNSEESYPAEQTVRGSDGFLYAAVVGNIGNDPVTDSGTNWKPATKPIAPVGGNLTLPASAGDTIVTGIGFKPKFVLFAASYSDGTSFSVTSSGSGRVGSNSCVRTNTGTTWGSFQVLALWDILQAGSVSFGNVTSFEADGFTVTRGGGTNVAVNVAYVAYP